MDKKSILLKGLRDGIPIALGYFAVALSLGININNINASVNRGGGTLGFRLWNANPETEERPDTDVEVFRDGRRYTEIGRAHV